jgi:GTP diphosphokinase / guanosine-3',5'-bis(diphosphate) 3'-diphosphatase
VNESISSTNLKQAVDQLWLNFEPKIKYLKHEEQEIIQLAFWQMVEAHKEQRRKSGDFYIIHPVAATTILAGMELDVDTLAACLMHDVPEDTDVTLRDLEKNFSKDVVFLVFGITKLGKIKYQGMDRYAENLRKMFVAMSRDLRVIFIKLADRLHNLKTLDSLPPEKALRIAKESLEIYVPIAERLGINYLKSEIEDAAFPYVYPEEYKQFVNNSKLEIEKRKETVTKLIIKTQEILDKADLKNLEIKGRAKKYYSVYRKTIDKDKNLEDIKDLVALRVVTHDVDECYLVLSELHKHFEPQKGTYKDYISKPKINGYQSLHTAVKDLKGEVFEFQIRTKEMDDFAKFGVAAHWAYKARGRQQNKTENFLDPENFKWITELVDLGKEDISQEEYLQHVKLDMFTDRIFVMTPKGDVIDLPEGATPLDFAYKIHQEIGSHAVMAKVNDTPARLSDELHNGDVITITTDKKQHPKSDWLKWVKTSQAAKLIRAELRVLNKKAY